MQIHYSSMIHLDSNDAVSIREVKIIVSDRFLEMNLIFIHATYDFLPTTITQLWRTMILYYNYIIYNISLYKLYSIEQ